MRTEEQAIKDRQTIKSLKKIIKSYAGIVEFQQQHSRNLTNIIFDNHKQIDDLVTLTSNCIGEYETKQME